jgi:hypothetical protein
VRLSSWEVMTAPTAAVSRVLSVGLEMHGEFVRLDM